MKGYCFILISVVAGFIGCRQDMFDQPKAKPMAASEFFADGTVARPPVEGTIARGELREDTGLQTGRESGEYLARIPILIDAAGMERGRERYDIFCAACHGRTGRGEGMIVRHGFPRPESFHEPRLRKARSGYVYDAITNGFGTMYPFADRLEVEDRWRIVAYMRALQRADAATMDDVPASEVERLTGEER